MFAKIVNFIKAVWIYDTITVLSFTLHGKDFLEEREKWIIENKN